ncbi:MAG TPA: SDR family oxidoreductase [Blastocatellia bacterium]|nr:SDR family oxidoreductase [Blastocatellia bacterium]
MNVRLKKLSEQVMVITGATSGIGLVTARMASKRGARVVLTARDDDALRQITEEIAASGGEAIHVAADVADEAELRRVAEAAVERFGGFDTWVNNAGVSIYGKLLEISIEDQRRLFETNFWGVVYGSRIAALHLCRRGGALINVGSTLSDRAIPLQGMYCASKHAVKGYTDALRMELEHDGMPVSVTLIKPAAIDTPYTRHARNYLPNEPQNPPPVYAPDVVAEAILHCATHPVRDLFVGGGAKAMSALGHYAPRLADKVMERTMFSRQKSDRPERHPEVHSLYAPINGLKERGGYRGHVAESSLYTAASMHPLIAGAAVVGAGLALGALWRAKR